MAKTSKLDKMSDRTIKISKIISAVIVIFGAFTGVFAWVSNQFSAAVSAQIADFRAEVEKSDKEQTRAITRLELMELMESDPTNVAGIEKLARYYFNTLQGDQYMTGVFSKWCQEYGGDASIIVGKD